MGMELFHFLNNILDVRNLQQIYRASVTWNDPSWAAVAIWS